MLEQKIVQANGYTTAETTIADECGMHAKPSALIAKKCAGYGRQAYIIKNGDTNKKYNCKEIMDLMTMEAEQGTPMRVFIQGIDDKARKVCSDILDVLNSDLDTIKAEFNKEKQEEERRGGSSV